MRASWKKETWSHCPVVNETTHHKIKDLGTILGIVIGILMLFFSIGFHNIFKFFFNIPSIMIVFGGTLAATLVNFPLHQVVKMIRWLKVIFVSEKTSPHLMIHQVVYFAEKIKTEGRLAVVKETDMISHAFLKSGLRLILDKVNAEELESLLKEETQVIHRRHEQGIVFFETVATYAPAFGLVGTLIGLILMLRNLNDPKSIGPNMGIALVTTFYGITFANLICLPISGRLQMTSNEELLLNEMIVRGLVSLAKGDAPLIIREKMMTYLSASERAKGELPAKK